MKLLIVGGTGVISTAITNRAVDVGFDVSILNRGQRTQFVNNKVHLLKSDIHNTKMVEDLLMGQMYDCIIDCLCYTLEDLKHSLSLFAKKCKQYVFISTCAVYDTKNYADCNEETPKPLKLWPYSVNKWNCEVYLNEYAKENNLNVTIIRPGVTYGNTRIPYGITPDKDYHYTIIERILHDKPIITWNGGKNRSNIMRVEDLAVGVVGLIGNEKSYGQAFNVCSDKTYSWDEVLSTIEEVIGKKCIRVDLSDELYAKQLFGSRKLELLGGRALDASNNNGKLKKYVPEFKETYTLKSGIVETIEYYKSHNRLKGIDYEYDGECDRIASKVSGKSYYFIDYTGHASKDDKRQYVLSAKRDNPIFFALFVINKIIKKYKK